MKRENYEYFCRCLGKTLHIPVRLYENEQLQYQYSVFPLTPDPVAPFLEEMLRCEHPAGILATPLHQIYGFLEVMERYRLVIGPSRIQNDDPTVLTQQMFLLGVPQDQRESYVRTLQCMSATNAERMGWLLGLLSMALERRKLPVNSLYTNFSADQHNAEVQKQQITASVEELGVQPGQDFHDWEYNLERMMMSYIQNGEADKMRDFLSAPPNMKGGQMAADSLRQVKNTCICVAAIASRTAIAGGVDHAAAFHLSDLYIQKVELLQDIPSLEKLRCDMFISFAELVRKVRYHTEVSPDGKTDDLFSACAEYVTRNIYSVIRIEEMADALGYTRSYLCGRFKAQTGLTLTQYATQQKILEAQRMLELTDSSLGEIAELFAFSSQSHFQNVFKRVTGETPLAYRQRVRGKRK